MRIRLKVLLFVLTTSCLYVHAQVQLSSPISTLGFGELVDRDVVFIQSIGGTRASFHSRDEINIGNPASLAHLRTTVFSGGLFAERTKISDRSNTSNVWTGNIGYLSLGMPLQNEINALFNRKESKIKWGLNLTLQPYTITGFDFNDVSRLSNGDTVVRSYSGDGSTYIASISNGWQYGNVSFGLTLGHLFGATTYDRGITFTDDHTGFAYSYTTTEKTRTNFRSFVWNAGLMYDIVFNRIERADGTKGRPNKYLTLGLTYHSNRPLKTETDRVLIAENLRLATITRTDTLSVSSDIEGEGTLPAVMNFGITYVYKNSWLAGLNYERSLWSEFRDGSDAQTQDTKDAFRISGGFAYTPNASSITSYFDKITYSIGFQYAKDPRILNGDQIENTNLKVGFKLPFVGQRQVSYLNLNVGFGRLGLPDGYKENYVTFGLGYSLTDNSWFIKRKYD